MKKREERETGVEEIEKREKGDVKTNREGG
jgi:hypothetical protein